MPPQQNQYPAPQQQSPYDFFLEPEKPGGRMPGIGPDGTSPIKKLLFIGGVVVLVMVILAAIIAMVSKPAGNAQPLTIIAQDQTELMRVAKDADKNSKSTTILNFAATTENGLASAQQSLLDYMGKQGIKTDEKTLALGHSAQTDQALSAALSADTYDSTYSTIMKNGLDKYISHMGQELTTAQSQGKQNETKLLDGMITGAQLLEKQLVQQ